MFNLTPTVRNLLLINIAVYLLQQVESLHLTQLGSLYPLGSPFFRPWQFLTHMFMHANLLHIFSNMFGLINFGPLLEQRWGGQRFLTFWLICGIGAGALYEGVRTYEMRQLATAYETVVREPDAANFVDFMKQVGIGKEAYEPAAAALERNATDPQLRQGVVENVRQLYTELLQSPGGGMLGASGALFGVLFAFGYLFPNTILMLLFPPIPLKAKYFVGLYALYELYSGVHRTPGDNVAHFAHIGGLVIGFVLIKIWERGRGQFY